MNRNGNDARTHVLNSVHKGVCRTLGCDATDPAVERHPTMVASRAVRWPKSMKLLGSSRKVAKGTKRGFLTAVLYLAPGNRSLAYGGSEVCPWRTEACSALCLGHTSGQLALPSGQNAEAWKTLLWTHARSWFLAILVDDIAKHVARARRKGLQPVVRLNGSSDIPWERVLPDVFRAFPTVQFYDYTKSLARARDNADRRNLRRTSAEEYPPNLHLTFSRSEHSNDPTIVDLAGMGANTAIVADSMATLRERFPGIDVVDGDETDLRFLDPKGCIVWLSPKGTACKKDDSGFVVRA